MSLPKPYYQDTSWHPKGIKPYYADKYVFIIHGDCRDILPQLPKVDLVLTDPPYKLSQEYSQNIDADNLLALSSIWQVASACIPIVRAGGLWVMFYDTRILPVAIDAMKQAGWKYLRGLTLYRRWGNAHQLHGWMSTSDFILIYHNPEAKPKFQNQWRHDVYIRDKPEPEGVNHPAQKPLFCLKHIIENCSALEEIVLDPYMGSGSTLVASKALNRHCIGIEIEEKYCEIAAKRCSQDVMELNIKGGDIQCHH